jgi:hypothetical protein
MVMPNASRFIERGHRFSVYWWLAADPETSHKCRFHDRAEAEAFADELKSDSRTVKVTLAEQVFSPWLVKQVKP